MSSSENPLSSNESSTAEVLIKRVDQGDVPTPFAGSSILTTHNSAAAVGALDAADVLVGDRVLEGGPIYGGERVVLEWVDWIVSLDVFVVNVTAVVIVVAVVGVSLVIDVEGVARGLSLMVWLLSERNLLRNLKHEFFVWYFKTIVIYIIFQY